jgi:hypothetical protein
MFGTRIAHQYSHGLACHRLQGSLHDLVFWVNVGVSSRARPSVEQPGRWPALFPIHLPVRQPIAGDQQTRPNHRGGDGAGQAAQMDWAARRLDMSTLPSTKSKDSA